MEKNSKRNIIVKLENAVAGVVDITGHDTYRFVDWPITHLLITDSCSAQGVGDVIFGSDNGKDFRIIVGVKINERIVDLRSLLDKTDNVRRMNDGASKRRVAG